MHKELKLFRIFTFAKDSQAIRLALHRLSMEREQFRNSLAKQAHTTTRLAETMSEQSELQFKRVWIKARFESEASSLPRKKAKCSFKREERAKRALYPRKASKSSLPNCPVALKMEFTL